MYMCDTSTAIHGKIAKGIWDGGKPEMSSETNRGIQSSRFSGDSRGDSAAFRIGF
jgi:hypothetical protein